MSAKGERFLSCNLYSQIEKSSPGDLGSSSLSAIKVDQLGNRIGVLPSEPLGWLTFHREFAERRRPGGWSGLA